MKIAPALVVIVAAVPTMALNPITRVVELLEGLSKKLTFEAKKEEDMYDKYVCWAQTVIQTKTATNEAAKTRIQSLETYIADIEAGRVEFGSERGDLTQQIAELNQGMEKAGDMRDQEHEDFLAAKEEMETAIKALEEAVDVLSKVNKGDLLSVKFDLRRVLKFGMNMLDKDDLKYLEQELDADSPMSKKSPFTKKYASKSKKILQIIEDMKKTFEDNLKDAEDKEEKAKKNYDDLMESKGKELDTAKEALTEMAGEGGASAVAKEESQAEVDDLKDQVKADEGFIEDTEKALKEKKELFKERKKVRMAEIAAISEAIGVLRDDDARDTFKKSRGLLFLQTKSIRKVVDQWKQIRTDAAESLRAAGAHANDPRLILLALQVRNSQGDGLGKVIKEIDKMIKKLKKDQKKDDTKKKDCKKDRKEKTKESRELSLEIDDATEDIKSAKEKIEENEAQIKESKAAIEKLEAELKEATEQREDEKAAFEQQKAEDESAVELIEKAKEKLKEFYEDSGMVLAQTQMKKQKPEVEAGEEPPPPPETFEGDYEGAGDAAKGIQEIMEKIQDDIKDDIKENEEGEKEAVKAFKELKKDTKESIKDEKSSIADAEEIISESESEITDKEGIKKDKSKLLEAVIEELKDMKDGCDFILVNFDLRKKNRELEVEGLKKAKEILEKAKK